MFPSSSSVFLLFSLFFLGAPSSEIACQRKREKKEPLLFSSNNAIWAVATTEPFLFSHNGVYVRIPFAIKRQFSSKILWFTTERQPPSYGQPNFLSPLEIRSFRIKSPMTFCAYIPGCFPLVPLIASKHIKLSTHSYKHRP